MSRITGGMCGLTSNSEVEGLQQRQECHRIPGGESMAEVLARALGEVDRIEKAHPGPALVALVSHGDVLRALITHFVGAPLDFLERLEIRPASVSVVALEEQAHRLLLLSSTAGSPSAVLSPQAG